LSNLRLSPPARSLFGPLFWLFVGLCIFGWLCLKSGPTGEAARAIAAAGPDGVTAYFVSPESAVPRINDLLAARAWTQLARYYDFTHSSVRLAEIVSGVYFAGGLAVAPESAIERPFPPGYRFFSSEPTELDGILRVIVVGAPPKREDASTAPQASFFLRADPEGYRIIPADAAGRMKAAASTP
jgi:hypothetical protein